ncbi:hypothetical protein K1719_034254 [Acacia pycnantha]|nr:hypothetical protein K1719_034254 [Acacia pycnantha]
MFLFDVIAFVITIDPLEEYYSEPTKEGNTVPMVLYDDCASTFAAHEFPTTQKPTVLLAQLARIGFDEGGRPEVCSSFNATKIHLNGNFQEVADFISSAEHLPSPTITSLTPTAATQNSSTAAETILRNTPQIKVSDIPLQEVGKYFAVICEIKKFLTRDKWFYEGCSRCGTKSQVTNGVASCGNNYCKGKKCTIQPKLRLNYLIADESGTASIVLFDKHATELLKKTASQLKAEIPENQIRFAFPKEVDNLLGKKMILKMKLNSFNKNHPNSSVSVATYAEATDLSDAFDAAATEVGQPSLMCDDDGEEIILMRNRIAEDKGPSTAKPDVTQSESLTTIDLDDISLSDDIHVIASKGKGRSLQRNILLML